VQAVTQQLAEPGVPPSPQPPAEQQVTAEQADDRQPAAGASVQ